MTLCMARRLRVVRESVRAYKSALSEAERVLDLVLRSYEGL